MTIADYDLVGSYNNQRVSSIDSERTVNLFEYIDPLSKKKKTLIPTSGLDSTNTDFPNTTGGFRASFYFNDNTYHVIGNRVWLIHQIGTALVPTLLNGSLPLTTSSGYVGVDANTFQIIFVDGLKGYIYDTMAQTFLQIVDAAFPASPVDVCYLDGFFVVADGGTNNFQLSSFNQGMVWGPASNQITTNNGVIPNQLIVGISNLTGGVAGTQNFATGIPVTLTLGAAGSLAGTGLAVATTYYIILIDATHVELATTYANAIGGIPVVLTGDVTPIINLVSDGQLQEGSITTHPGTIVACRTLHRRLFLFSQFFTEVWENAGAGTNLPFRRNNSLLMEYGTLAIGSVSVGFDTMFFLSQTRDGLGSVMEVIGTQSIPVSTKALDFQLARYASSTGITDCRGFLMRENGLIFYRMNFTTSNHTFVYNLTQSDPSQEQTRFWHEEEILDGTRHPAQTHVFYNGVNYVGHYSTPIFYEIDSDVYTNDGENIRRMRIGRPFVPAGYQRIRVDRFQIDLLQGQIQELIFDNVNLLTEQGVEILTEGGNNIVTSQTFPIDVDIDPVVFLSISKDGGQTYGNLISAPMGETGQRTFRTVWRKLGTTVRGQAFVPKIEFFNELPFVVLGAAWAFEVLPE